MKTRYLLFVFFTLAAIRLSCAQAIKPREVTLSDSDFKTIGPTPAILKEASGLYIDKNGQLWSHNDDRYPILYCFDTLGTVLKTVHFNHNNIGWEAVTSDQSGNLYIGAFGNNKNDRKDLSIIKIKPVNSITERVTRGEIIKFEYPDQTVFPPPPNQRNYDADALISFKDSLYIFTKNRTNPFTGYTRVYRLPQESGNYKAQLVDSIYVGRGHTMQFWITDAALSPDNQTLALLGHDKIWLITDFTGKKFSQGNITLLSLPHFTHKAGIAFSDNTTLYVVDEKEMEILGGYIYKLKIHPFIRKPK